jgi:hypothetical protein
MRDSSFRLPGPLMNRLCTTLDGKPLQSCASLSATLVNTSEPRAATIEPTVPPAVVGWLLFLCIILTLVFPATTLYRILAQTLPSLLGEQSPRSIFLLIVYCVVSAGLAVLSVIAGLKLWLVRPGAVRFARRWLWAYLIANFAYFGLWVSIAKRLTSLSLAAMGLNHVAGPIASFAIWYFYLEHSKRVRETYLGR